MTSNEEKKENIQKKKDQIIQKDQKKKQTNAQEQPIKEIKKDKKGKEKDVKNDKKETVVSNDLIVTHAMPNMLNEGRKQKKKFFCLTSFDDYTEQNILAKETSITDHNLNLRYSLSNLSTKLNICQENFGKINSKKLITLLENKNLSFNEEMEIFLLKLYNNKIGGISKVCKELIKALQSFIKKVDFSNIREMKEKIDILLELISIIVSPGDRNDLMKEIRVLGAIDNSFKYIRNLFNSIVKLRPKFNEKLRNFICKKLDEFISTKILATREAVADNASEIIKENDVLLLFGKSDMYRVALEKAKNKVKNFKIIFVDINGKDSIYSELDFFSNLGIEVTYTYINGVSALISNVTKVFILARCIFSNGFILGNNGSSMIACLAHNFKKPVIVFCETYKFCEKSQMDSYLYNSINIEKGHSKIDSAKSVDENVNYLTMQYDLTPSNFIKMIVCELGYLPTTSVPVVLREFGKIIELEEKELNYNELI